MILANLRMTVWPEKREEFLRSVQGILGPAHVEPGCISRRFYQDMDNENAFTFVEQWASQKDLDSHLSRTTFRMLIIVMDQLSEPPEIQFSQVSNTAGLEGISEAFEKHQEKNKKPELYPEYKHLPFRNRVEV